MYVFDVNMYSNADKFCLIKDCFLVLAKQKKTPMP